MRGADIKQVEMLVAFSLEQRIPEGHPLRTIRKLADAALHSMSGRLTTMYSHTGRPSIPPERLIRRCARTMTPGCRPALERFDSPTSRTQSRQRH